MFYYSNQNVAETESINLKRSLMLLTKYLRQRQEKCPRYVLHTVGGKVLAKKEFDVATRSGASWNSTTRKSEWNYWDSIWDMAVPNNYRLLLSLLASLSLAPHRSLVSADCLYPPDTDKRCPSPRVRRDRLVELRMGFPVSLVTSQQQTICRSASVLFLSVQF